jgi:predicted membrane protein (TIGR00267 family)
MSIWQRTGFLLRITRTGDIVRRYFVVNGFDGALTMLGLIIGFLVSDTTDPVIVLNVCLGAAVALGMSGFSSAYISEVAERRRALLKLEKAMVDDLGDSAHGEAARDIPILIALVNGSAPLVISLLILLPLFVSRSGIEIPVPPLLVAVAIALLLIFLLGVFLGRVAQDSWLRSGIRTLLVAMVTAALIYLLAGH